MSEASAKTSIGPIALIAIEQYYQKSLRVIDDDLAYHMLPLSSKIFVRLLKSSQMRDWIIGLSDKTQPGIWGGLLCRKRYIDDRLAASAGNIEAVVNLGAGFDTRDFRLSSLSDIPIWELDQPENIGLKEARLRSALGTIPANVKFVPMDFDREDLTSALASQGYSAGRRTFFIMEAVTQYLTGKGIDEVFGFLSNAAKGSLIAFTYVRKDFFDGKALYGWESGYKRFVRGGIWHSAFDPVMLPAYLGDFRWKIIEDKGYDELADGFLKPSGRNLKSTPVERMVFAEKI